VSLNFGREASRFFSSVFKNTLMVILRALYTEQSAAETGVCSQTGHDEGKVDWPSQALEVVDIRTQWSDSQALQIAVSQHGRR
jgi:hypothetical protein